MARRKDRPGKECYRGQIENWAVQNENVVTSRRVVFVSSEGCLESGTTAFVPVERSLVTRDHIPANGFVEEYPRSRSVRLKKPILVRTGLKGVKQRRTSNLIRVRCACIMRINLFRCCALVEADKAL
jgi:hypothetical protein